MLYSLIEQLIFVKKTNPLQIPEKYLLIILSILHWHKIQTSKFEYLNVRSRRDAFSINRVIKTILRSWHPIV